jgi:hypothetical protein
VCVYVYMCLCVYIKFPSNISQFLPFYKMAKSVTCTGFDLPGFVDPGRSSAVNIKTDQRVDAYFLLVMVQACNNRNYSVLGNTLNYHVNE